MSPPPVQLWSLQKSSGTFIDTVNYQKLKQSSAPNRTPGALRVIKVGPLLSNPPTIVIEEFSGIKFGSVPSPKVQLSALQKSRYRYVAISHVWDYGVEINQELNNMPMVDELHIAVTDDGKKSKSATKNISWRGLIQIAHALNSGHLGKVDYFWLDFLCIDQIKKRKNDDKEKALQICIMGDIYRYASSVLIMIGGIPSVQSASSPTAWMDRAWTLQEAILNPRQWVYLKWSTTPTHLSIPDTNPMARSSGKPVLWTFNRVYWKGPEVKPGEDFCLVTLRHLLDLTDAQPLASPPGLPNIVVLDGMVKNAGDAPRRALRACLSGDPKVRYTGVWRSMFMRTSSHPVDVVYSLMAIFNTPIDPYRNNRTATFVFNDLARKTAARSLIGPVWLTIAGIAGSEIPRNQKSAILPKFPHAKNGHSNKPPKMQFGKKKEWVGYHVDDSPFYIPRYDIKFLTHSAPHIINATMLKVKSHTFLSPKFIPRSGNKRSKRTVATIQLGSMTGKCTYFGRIPNKPRPRSVYALYVGKVADMRKSSAALQSTDIVEFGKAPLATLNFAGQHCLLFIEWDKKLKKWEYIADGSFKPGTGWNPPPGRYMLTIGAGAQTAVWRWPVPNSLRSSIGPDNLDFRKRGFHHSYGFQPLPDYKHTPAMKHNIKWEYHKVLNFLYFSIPTTYHSLLRSCRLTSPRDEL